MPRVCPSIPVYLIGDALIACRLNLMSPIKSLTAGLKRNGYEHILSSRRQVFVANEEQNIKKKKNNIPEFIGIEHDNTEYKIYLITDSTCFICKNIGHGAPYVFATDAQTNKINRITTKH